MQTLLLYPSKSPHWPKINEGRRDNCVLVIDITGREDDDDDAIDRAPVLAVTHDMVAARCIASALIPGAKITE